LITKSCGIFLIDDAVGDDAGNGSFVFGRFGEIGKLLCSTYSVQAVDPEVVTALIGSAAKDVLVEECDEGIV